MAQRYQFSHLGLKFGTSAIALLESAKGLLKIWGFLKWNPRNEN